MAIPMAARREAGATWGWMSKTSVLRRVHRQLSEEEIRPRVSMVRVKEALKELGMTRPDLIRESRSKGPKGGEIVYVFYSPVVIDELKAALWPKAKEDGVEIKVNPDNTVTVSSTIEISKINDSGVLKEIIRKAENGLARVLAAERLVEIATKRQ